MNCTHLRTFWVGVIVLLLPIFLKAQVQPVTASVKGGNFTSAFSVSLNTATAGATIRYTLDGSEPDSLTSAQYSAPLAPALCMPLAKPLE